MRAISHEFLRRLPNRKLATSTNGLIGRFRGTRALPFSSLPLPVYTKTTTSPTSTTDSGGHGQIRSTPHGPACSLGNYLSTDVFECLGLHVGAVIIFFMKTAINYAKMDDVMEDEDDCGC